MPRERYRPERVLPPSDEPPAREFKVESPQVKEPQVEPPRVEKPQAKPLWIEQPQVEVQLTREQEMRSFKSYLELMVSEEKTERDAREVATVILKQLYKKGLGEVTAEEALQLRDEIVLYIQNLVDRGEYKDEQPSGWDTIFGPKGIISRSFVGGVGRNFDELKLRQTSERFSSQIDRIDELLSRVEEMGELDDDFRSGYDELDRDLRTLDKDVSFRLSAIEHHYSVPSVWDQKEHQLLTDKIRKLRLRKRKLDIKFFGEIQEFDYRANE
jgi:hypothetical protein